MGAANGAPAIAADSLYEAVLLDLSVGVDQVELTLAHDTGVAVVGYVGETQLPPVFGGTAANHVVTVRSPVPKGLTRLSLRAPVETDIFIYAVCIPGEPEITRHIADELARWSQQGEVLEPHTDYRLAVTTRLEARGEAELAGYARDETATEFAYFRTGGPPGCAPAPSDATGLGDLTRYVRQTMPRSVPAPGERLTPPELVYRAYDLGVEFNETYTELMFRRAGRDLQLYLHDNNGPARDATGRVIVLDNQWGQAELLTLTEGEERWLLRVAGSACIPTVPVQVRRDSRLLAAASGQTLARRTPYEARLVPLLLREDFARVPPGTAASGSGATLGRWLVQDLTAPSRWTVREGGDPPSRSVQQDTGATTLLVCGDAHGEATAGWTSYRVSAFVRTPFVGVVGLAVRVQGPLAHYLVSYGADAGTASTRRQLVRVAGAERAVLAEDAAPSTPGADVEVIVEAIGSRLRVYERSTAAAAPTLLFDVTDATYATGAPALYAAGSTDARFADIRVDDFRDAAPVAYRFDFTTSRYAHFVHHLHSFQDETWRAQLPSSADLAPLLAAAADPGAPIGDAEWRAHDAFVALLDTAGAGDAAAEVRTTRVERADVTIAFRLESPEPLAWERIALSMLAADVVLPAGALPRALKLIDAVLGAAAPNEESITLLARDPLDLDGHRIEYRPLAPPGSTAPTPAWQPYYTFTEPLRVDAGTRVRIHGGSAAGAPPGEPGIVRRYAAPDGQQGSTRLSAAGVELRLVDRRGVAGHARAFLPSQRFAPLTDVRVLRGLDGTSVFLLRSGAPFVPAAHRIGLTFRRDNRAADPASPVLSMGGDIAAEHVRIDLPW